MTTKNGDDIGEIGLFETTNSFSGQSILLTKDERELYSAIKMLEADGLYELMQQETDKFSRLNPRAYTILLD